MQHKQVLRVGLLWHSITSDNLGVGALTLAQMALIKEAATRKGVDTEFTLIGTKGATPYPIDGFRIAGTAEFALRAFKAGNFDAIGYLRKCDIIFDIGEGDSFADIYGNKRLAIQVFAKMLAKLFGKKLILSPQTIGPFKTALGQRLGNLAMRMATRIYARDGLSMAVMKETPFADRTQEVIDVAFALPFERPTKSEGQSFKLGINVSGLLYNGGYSGANEFGLTVDYPALINRLCEHFLKMEGVEVYLVPHVISDAIEVEDDLRASEKLVQRYPGLKLAPRFKSPSEAKSFISGMDLFTGARMHACIAAFSSGVPVIPMAYSRKFNGLFNSLGYTAILDCLKATTDEGVLMISQAIDRRDELAADLQKGNLLAKRKLETYITEISELLPAK